MPTYRVLNSSRRQELGSRIQRADGFFTRLVGLMGRRALGPGEGLHILPCNSIHTFFMRFPIDVVFLNAEGQVVKAFHALRPWRISSIYARAESVLELPSGALEGSGTQEGDVLVFEKAEHL